MAVTATRYCACGQPISVGWRHNGYMWVAEYHDPATEKPVVHCPTCGDQLRLSALAIDPDEEAQ